MSKFDMGQIVVTNGISLKMDSDIDFVSFVHESMGRYRNCEWGSLAEEDKKLNDEAVSNGNMQILAEYYYKESDEKIWIITNADRKVTTILFPHEY